MAIAKGSPCVVPSCDRIDSPSTEFSVTPVEVDQGRCKARTQDLDIVKGSSTFQAVEDSSHQ